MADEKPIIELSRRKALAAVGTIGAAGVLGGFGTKAFLSDTENVQATYAAGQVDLKLSWKTFLNGEQVTDTGRTDTEDGQLVGEYESIMPGDTGCILIGLHLLDTPAWIWMRGQIIEALENEVIEPEKKAGDDQETGELHGSNLSFNNVHYVETAKPNCTFDSDDIIVVNDESREGEALTQVKMSAFGKWNGGVLLDGDRASRDNPPTKECFRPSTTHWLALPWTYRKRPATEDLDARQSTDSVKIGFDFFAEQCQHNAEPTNPFQS